MYTLAKVSIFINILALIRSTYLEAEPNYRPRAERNNILNKGLWMKKLAEERRPGSSVFKTNSFDIDHVLEHSNNGNDDDGESLPFFTGYVSRNKRDAQALNPERETNSSKSCKNNECSSNGIKRGITILNSVNNTNIVLNDSINKEGLVSHTDHYNILHNIRPHVYTPVDPNTKYYITEITKDFEKIMKPLWVNNLNKNTMTPLKDMKSHGLLYSLNDINSDSTNVSRSIYELPLLKTVSFGKKMNSTKNAHNYNAVSKNQNATPYNASEVQQEKTMNVKSRIISEKGLLNVLAMLTRSFKRIMRQHNVIKLIHSKLHNLNSEVTKNLEIITKKFEDFDSKYNEIMKISENFNDKVKSIDDHRQSLVNKEKELSNNLVQFGKQQKEFIKQQSQFYIIQRQMLQQNEIITNKQAKIAKNQNEISAKQNYISKLIKKVYQMPITKNNPKGNNVNKINTNKYSEKELRPTLLTTISPSPETVKINLLSEPRYKEFKNYDKDMIRDKDEQSIDDLIYKYYFNNTFIAEIIKNKLFATVVNVADSKHNSIKSKPPRMLTTPSLLHIPSSEEPKHRERRWIRRSKKKTQKVEYTTVIPKKTNLQFNPISPINMEKSNTDPFLKMAMTFCTELDQDQNVQTFNWCVEKALRRLQAVEFKKTATPGVTNNTELNTTEVPLRNDPLKFADKSVTPNETHKSSYFDDITSDKSSAKYFPDNDELETNLKQYDLKPDHEGTVYFDGSLHISDVPNIDKKDLDSEGFSDIIPGLDSNSKVDVDPTAIQLQAQRRAEVRRINENMNRINMA